AMHRAPRANPLHDFLPDVASLVEVQRASLLGFLGQIAVADIDSIKRNPTDDAMHVQSLRSDCSGAVSHQGVPRLLHIFGRKPKLVVLVPGVVPTHDGALHTIAVTGAVRLENLQRLGIRNGNAGGSQNLPRFRPTHTEESQ